MRTIFLLLIMLIPSVAFGAEDIPTQLKNMKDTDSNRKGMLRMIADAMPKIGGDSLFFRDIRNNRIGIGTQTPEAKLDVDGNIYPTTNNSYYLGKNDDDSPKAWIGIILKDTSNGKYYRLQITGGIVTVVDLTD
jgi:hypothetical protein